MAQSDADELRAQVKELLALAADTPDTDSKRRLASRAFSLAQDAEALERSGTNGHKLNPDPNFKIVAESNIQRFVEDLYVERDGKLRELYQDLALKEERWYGIKQERLDMLMRLLRECDGRVVRVTAVFQEQRASGVAIEDAQCLLDNLLDTQKFLRKSLRVELARQDTPF